MRAAPLQLMWALGVVFGLAWNISVDNPQRAAILTPVPTSSAHPKHGVIIASTDSSFLVEGKVNDSKVPVYFVLDTGASGVLISYHNAIKLGFEPKPEQFTQKSYTVNGAVFDAPIVLKKLEIGGIVVENVRASIAPKGGYDGNLLGMSFLKQVSWTYYNGRILLEQ